MRVAGLTGGIACGKSTVSLLFVSENIYVVDCDVLAHHVERKVVLEEGLDRGRAPEQGKAAAESRLGVQGNWGYKRIVKAFGRDILRPDGEANELPTKIMCGSLHIPRDLQTNVNCCISVYYLLVCVYVVQCTTVVHLIFLRLNDYRSDLVHDLGKCDLFGKALGGFRWSKSAVTGVVLLAQSSLRAAHGRACSIHSWCNKPRHRYNTCKSGPMQMY